MKNKKLLFAIVDIETTGGFASQNAITEIAINIHDGEKVIEKFESLIKPFGFIPYNIQMLTGITNEMVKDAPSFEMLAPKIFELLNNKVFVAHNVNFDFSFIKSHLSILGYSFLPQKLCTVRMARKVFPGLYSYSLGKLCTQLFIPHSNAHRAYGDVAATTILFEKILQNDTDNIIAQMLKKGSNEQNIPANLDKKYITKLPLLPGIYFFKNAQQQIIYVGKALQIKKRVLSHFSGTDLSKRRQSFLKEIYSIDFEICYNELEALIKENSNIQKYWPKYNYAQKKTMANFGICKYEDNNGFFRLVIVKKKASLPIIYHFNLIHEGYILLRKIAEQFKLSAEFCGLTGTALQYGLEQKVYSLKKHNKIIDDATNYLTNSLPNFVIKEWDQKNSHWIIFYINQGKYIGCTKIDADDFSEDGLQYHLNKIEQAPDNDYIRGLLNNYKTRYPEKVISFN